MTDPADNPPADRPAPHSAAAAYGLLGVVLGESVTVSLLLGLMLIVGGVAIVAWSDRRETLTATGG